MKRIEGITPTTLATLAINAQALLALKGGSYDSEAWLYTEDAADFAGTLAGDVITLARGAA